MTRPTPCRLPRTALAIAALSILGGNAHGHMFEDFRAGAWEGAASLGLDTGRDRTRSDDATADIDSKPRRTLEQVDVRNNGYYYLDPRIFSGNASVTLGRISDSFETNGRPLREHSSLIGYGLDATALSGLPYGGNLFAHRNQSVNWQPFGRTQLDSANRGLALALREDSPLRDRGLPFLSASARLEQQHTQETTVSALGQSFHRDELRKLLTLDAHKGFETGDLEVRYDHDDLRNPAFPQTNFKSRNAGLNFSWDFGPGLSRRSDSRVLYSSRSGANPLTLMTLDERLRIDHYQNLSTDYSYLLTRMDSLAGRAESHDAAFGVKYRPYRDLSTDGSLNMTRQSLPGGTRDSRFGQANLQYRHEAAERRSVFASASGRYQLNDNRMVTSNIQVVDEGQAAPTPLGAGSGFALNQPFVQAGTIVVVDTRGGALLPTVLGLDYEVVQEGSTTRIVPLPTSAVILPGDPLAVSYTYSVDPSLEYSTVGESVRAGVDWRWITFTLGHERSSQRKISGQQDLFLQSQRKDSAQIDLRREWDRGRAQAGLGWVRYDSTRLVYSQRRFTPLISYRPTRTLTLSLNGDWTATNYELPLHRTSARGLRASADWYANRWSLTAGIGRRIFQGSQQSTEAINEANFGARFTYGKLDFSAGFMFAGRHRDPVETSTWRLNFLAIRRF